MWKSCSKNGGAARHRFYSRAPLLPKKSWREFHSFPQRGGARVNHSWTLKTTSDMTTYLGIKQQLRFASFSSIYKYMGYISIISLMMCCPKRVYCGGGIAATASSWHLRTYKLITKKMVQLILVYYNIWWMTIYKTCVRYSAPNNRHNWQICSHAPGADPSWKRNKNHRYKFCDRNRCLMPVRRAHVSSRLWNETRASLQRMQRCHLDPTWKRRFKQPHLNPRLPPFASMPQLVADVLDLVQTQISYTTYMATTGSLGTEEA